MFNPGVLNNSRGNLVNVWGLIITPGANVTSKNNFAIITFISNNTGTLRLNLTNVIISNQGSASVPVNISNISINIVDNTAIILPDKTPPASIRYLKKCTYAPYYIKWTWTDPTDPDFAKVMIYLNGKYVTSVQKGVKYYNATGLMQGTLYTLSTRTVDLGGNINSTWVNYSARTMPDKTPPASYKVFEKCHICPILHQMDMD